MIYLKIFEEFDLSKSTYKDLISTFIDEMFNMGGLSMKLAFIKDDQNASKLYQFLTNKVRPSFSKDLTLDYKWYYDKSKELLNVIYLTIKYIKPLIHQHFPKYINIINNIENKYRKALL